MEDISIEKIANGPYYDLPLAFSKYERTNAFTIAAVAAIIINPIFASPDSNPDQRRVNPDGTPVKPSFWSLSCF